WVTFGICRAFLTAHCGESKKYPCLLSYLVKNFSTRILSDIVGNGESTIGAGAFRMDDTLRNTFPVEMCHLFVKYEVLKKNRSSRPCRHGVLILVIRDTGCSCQFLLICHVLCS